MRLVAPPGARAVVALTTGAQPRRLKAPGLYQEAAGTATRLRWPSIVDYPQSTKPTKMFEIYAKQRQGEAGIVKKALGKPPKHKSQEKQLSR